MLCTTAFNTSNEKNTDWCRPNATRHSGSLVLIRVIMCLTMAFNYRIFYVHPWPQMNHFFYCDSELSSINLTNKTHEDGGEVQKFSFGHRER